MENNWISVKERLPELYECVEILGNGKCQPFGDFGYVESHGCLQYHDGDIISFYNYEKCLMGEIIAWRPCTEPYEIPQEDY